MLAKAIATGFNCPFVLMPGSGFQQTFMGMDAVIVRWLARKAKKLARKWGGQCIVFIDEIDAVGMRRAALGGGASYTRRTHRGIALLRPLRGAEPDRRHDPRDAAPGATGCSTQREPAPEPRGLGRIFNQGGGAFPGMMGGGGQLALNQLLVVMDGIDNPPFFRRLFTNWTNTLLDASYIIPAKAGRFSLRVPRPKPRKDQIYFIGATNVPISQLDPALTRPGRMGRHVWLRTPTKIDRKDILDLYIGKVDARARAGRGQEARRARAHHERVQPGDARAGLLDGAHVRPCRRSRALRLGRHPRGDDHGRVRAPRSTSSTRRRTRGPSPSTSRGTRPRATST